MKNKKKLLQTLFTSTFYLSAFTFGGGYVIVPLMKKKFVHELGWIEEDEMLDLIAIGQSSPGPIAVNTAIIIGYRMAGILGALVSAVGIALPTFLIMSLVSTVFAVIQDNVWANHFLLGMQAAVAAIILNVVYDMAMRILKNKQFLPILVMLFSLGAGIYLKMNILYILLIAALIGALRTYWTLTQKSSSKKED